MDDASGERFWSMERSGLGVVIQDQTELQFSGGEGVGGSDETVTCVQTNMPLPKVQDVYYFEVKLMDKPVYTNLGIGLATKLYPCWRFPGRNKHSVGYFTEEGRKYFSDPYEGKPYGVPCYEGDVVGCGYRPRTGAVFFSRNGVKFDIAYTGLKTVLFPTVAANGPCQVEVNLGQAGFVLIEANVKKWGLAPALEAIVPPPAYGVELDTILLERGMISSGSSGGGEGSRTERRNEGSRRTTRKEIRYKSEGGAPRVLLDLRESESPPRYGVPEGKLVELVEEMATGEEEDVEMDAAAYEGRVEGRSAGRSGTRDAVRGGITTSSSMELL